MSESRRRATQVLLVLALPLLGLLELAAHLWLRDRAPDFAAYEALGPGVAPLRQDGDLVVVEPRWAEPLVFGAVPVSIRQAAPPDLEGYEHAVEVSLFGARSPRTEAWRLLESREIGAFTVRRLENPHPRPSVFDFVDALSPRHAEVSFDDRRCLWTASAPVVAGGLGGHPAFPSARFSCGEQPWFNVSETVIADERFRPRRCLWAHPPSRGALTIRYHDVTLGERLVGHGGMYWIIERERKGTPVHLTVTVDGESVGEHVHRDGDGWARFEMALGRFAGERVAEVTFAVRSDDYRDRHFCFEARSQ